MGKKKLLTLQFEVPDEHLGFDKEDYQVLVHETVNFFGCLVQKMSELKEQARKEAQAKVKPNEVFKH